MSADGWCIRHRDRLHATNDARFACEALVVKRAIETGRLPGPNGCWACPLSENEFQDALREGGVLVASAEAYGGTYTAAGILMSVGSPDKESSS